MRRRLLLLAVMFAVAPVGAGVFSWWSAVLTKSDFHVYLTDARGLKEEAKVVWRGMEVGHVSRMRMAEGRIRTDIVVDSAYRKQVHGGVKAWPVRDLLGRRDTYLKLIDAADAAGAEVERGGEISEARFYEAVTKRQLGMAGGALLLLLFVLILKGIKKLIFLGFVVLLLGGGWTVLRRHWPALQEFPALDEIQEQAGDLLEQLRSDPATEPVAKRVHGLVDEALKKVEGGGPEAVERIRTELAESLDDYSRRLREQGRAEAAQTVDKLKGVAARLLSQRADADRQGPAE